MSELRSSIVLDLTGNLERQSRRFSSTLGRLSTQGARHMGALSRATSSVGRGLDRLGNRYTALITGAAGAGTLRMIGNLEERFTRLGIQAGQGADEIERLKRQIFEVAKAPEIRVDPGQITSAIEQIVEKTGDLKFAQDNIRNIGLAIQATGAEGQAIGGILAEFQKMGMNGAQSLEALDILTVQGKAGAFTLEKLAALGPRVVTAYTAMGRSGVTAMREMGAALQVIMQGAGSPEQAATSFEALLRVLGDAKKAKILEQGGIKIFDEEAAKEGLKVFRPINELIVDIVEKAKGDKTLIQQVLGDSEAARAFNSVVSEFQRTGAVRSMQSFYDVQADGTTITRDSIRAAKDFNAAMTNLYTVWQQFADDQLTEPVKKLTEALDGLEPGTVENWLKIGGAIATATGAAFVGRKAYQGGRALFGMFGKGGKGGSAAGGLAGGAFGDAIPVYVVNGPSSIFNPGGPGAKPSGPSTAGAGRLAPLLASGQAMIPAAGAALVGLASIKAGQAITDRQVAGSSTERLKELRSRHMVMGGGAGTYQVQAIDAELARRFDQGFSGEIRISFDDEGRPRVKGMSTSPGLDIDVDSGRNLVGVMR